MNDERPGDTGPTEGSQQPGGNEPTSPGEPDQGNKPTAWWTATSATSPGGDRLPMVRLIWAAAVALLALIVWAASGPSGSGDWEGDIRSANSTASLNNSSAEGAPQQTVVNGWHQVELAEIQIRQGADLLAREAQTANLLLVLTLGLMGDLALRAFADRDAARRQRRGNGVLGL